MGSFIFVARTAWGNLSRICLGNVLERGVDHVGACSATSAHWLCVTPY